MSSTWWESRDPFYQEALGKMDTILKGILDSTHTESMKHELFRTIAEKGNQRHPTNVIKAVLNLTSEWVLNNDTEFIQRSGFQIFSSWSRYHVSILEDFFNTEFLVSLLSLNVSNPANAVSLMHESIRILMRTQSLPKLLKIAESKSINFIHDHPDIETIKNYTVFLTDFKECIPKGEFTGSLCQAIIMGMSKFKTPDGMDRLQNYIQEVNCIAKFLFFIWNHTDSSAVFQSLKAIFGIIVSSDNTNNEPSVCLSSVIHYVPVDMIDIVTKNLVDDPNISDAKMSSALNHMFYWLSWPTSRNIDQWVMALLKTLAAYNRYNILASVTEARVEQLFENLRYYPVREGSLNVLSHMLLSFQHSPHAFHKILPLVPETMRILREERTPSSSQCLNRLADLFHCLMHQHAGYPELYDPLFESIKGYPKPTPELIQLRLAQSKWGVQKRESLMHVSPLLQKSDTGHVGLVNLGNSCYMNVIIQALFMCTKFRESIFQLPAHPALLSTKLQQVFAFLLLSQRGAYAPVRFLQDSRPSWFTPGSQQDCSEYMRYLLEQIHENSLQCWKLSNGHDTSGEHVNVDATENGPHSSDTSAQNCADVNNSSAQMDIDSNVESLKKDAKGKQVPDKNENGVVDETLSFIENIFGGKMINVVKCLSCGHSVTKIETFSELYLNFPLVGLQFQKNSTGSSERAESSQTKVSSEGTSKQRSGSSSHKDDLSGTAVCSPESSKSIHLNMLIKNYLQSEKLKGYQCDICNTTSEAERTVKVIKSPDYLVISLQRFSYDSKRQVSSKILREVKYPKTLFLPIYSESSQSKSDSQKKSDDDASTIYGLNSVVIHSGVSSDCGHYYTYSRAPVMLSQRRIEKVIEQSSGNGNDFDFFQDKWLLFNDSRVSSASYKTFSTVSRRFNKDTVYMLIYRRINESELKKRKSDSTEAPTQASSDEIIIPSVFKNEIINDNTEFLMTQEKEARSEQLKQMKKSSWYSGAFYQHPNNDDDTPKGPPPPSCGGGGGFGGLNNTSRFVY